MNLKFITIIFLFIFLTFSCSKKEIVEKKINQTSQEMEMINLYNEAYQLLINNDPYIAARKFLEAELLFPQSIWAPKSLLMASYSFYLQDYYS